MVPRLGVVTSRFSIKPTHQHKLWLKCASSPTSLYNSHQLSGWKNYEFVNGKDYPIYEMDFFKKKTWFKTTKQFSMISTYSPKKIMANPSITHLDTVSSRYILKSSVTPSCSGLSWEETSRGGELSSFSHGMA